MKRIIETAEIILFSILVGYVSLVKGGYIDRSPQGPALTKATIAKSMINYKSRN